jgi:RNA-binding protein YlmH
MEKNELSKIKILDKIRLYEKTGAIQSTTFLDPSEIIQNKNLYSKIPHTVFGGVENAERCILLIGSDDVEEARAQINIIQITSRNKLTHRSILGSLLGLGIKREVVGDIIVSDNIANVFVLSTICKYIIQNVDKIGKDSVSLREINYADVIEPEDNSNSLRTTVASLRIDSLISACYGLSRAQALELVEADRVKLNYLDCKSSSKTIHENDLVSVRGFGRFIIERIVGETKKRKDKSRFKDI